MPRRYLNRADVHIDYQFPAIRVTGIGAVYDLDDNSRHVNVSSLRFNECDIAFARCTPQVQDEIKQLFIAAALECARTEEERDG